VVFDHLVDRAEMLSKDEGEHDREQRERAGNQPLRASVHEWSF
jgi:hypothetical protein